MSRPRAFRLLAGEALRDALRSRVGLGVLLLALLLAMGADRCAGAGAGRFSWNGRVLAPEAAGAVLGPLLYVTLALALVAAAGLVASDALARPLEEGSAALWLARPVGRSTYALARLCGALLLAVGAAAPVLGFVTALLSTRFGLAWQPGAAGFAVFLADAVVVSAVAMLVSLFVPRLLALFGVFLWLQVVVFTNAMHVLGTIGGEGGARFVEGYGPPLGTALLFAVAPWVGLELDPHDLVAAALRLAVWGAGSLVLLLLAFRQHELRSGP